MGAARALRIAIAAQDSGAVAGHAGKARRWLVYECVPGAPLAAPHAVELAPAQVFHHFRDDGPHPLDGVDVVVAGSAGDGFLRHMARRGTEVLLTGESEPLHALERILAGEALPDRRFDPTPLLCKLRDLFSRH